MGNKVCWAYVTNVLRLTYNIKLLLDSLCFLWTWKRNAEWYADVISTSHSPPAGFVSIFQEDVLLHSLVILWVQAACSVLDFVMLEKSWACGLSITHRISSQNLKTPEDISFPQLKLFIYSQEELPVVIHHSALWEGRGGKICRVQNQLAATAAETVNTNRFGVFSRHPALSILLTSFSALWWLFVHSSPLHTLVSLPFSSLCLLSSSLTHSSPVFSQTRKISSNKHMSYARIKGCRMFLNVKQDIGWLFSVTSPPPNVLLNKKYE